MKALEKQIEQLDKRNELYKAAIFEGDDIDTGDVFNDLEETIQIIKQLLPKALKYNEFEKAICDKEFYQKLAGQNGKYCEKLINKLERIKAEINDQEPELALVKINGILKSK